MNSLLSLGDIIGQKFATFVGQISVLEEMSEASHCSLVY